MKGELYIRYQRVIRALEDNRKEAERHAFPVALQMSITVDECLIVRYDALIDTTEEQIAQAALQCLYRKYGKGNILNPCKQGAFEEASEFMDEILLNLGNDGHQ